MGKLFDEPKVSVIIPTKNRFDALERCLDSLTNQTYRRFEVIIVEGGSADRSKTLVKKYAGKLAITYLSQTKRGLANATNEGVRNSDGEIVIRTDDDIVAEENWLQEIVKVFCSSSKVGGVTGPTIIPEDLMKQRDLFYFQERMQKGNVFWSLLGRIYFNYFLEGEPLSVGKFFRSGAFSLGSNYNFCLKMKNVIEVDHHEACNLAVRRDLLEQIGGFDTTFTGIGDYNESDVSFKIRRLGYRIMFNPKAIVHHLPSTEGIFKDRPNSYDRMLNFINFYFRHIRPDTPDKFVRFFSYLLFLNGFWIYKFGTTRQASQLGCLKGTMVGLAQNILRQKVKNCLRL